VTLNEGVGGCNEGNPNATIMWLGAGRNEGGISNIVPGIFVYVEIGPCNM